MIEVKDRNGVTKKLVEESELSSYALTNKTGAVMYGTYNTEFSSLDDLVKRASTLIGTTQRFHGFNTQPIVIGSFTIPAWRKWYFPYWNPGGDMTGYCGIGNDFYFISKSNGGAWHALKVTGTYQ